MLYPIIYRQILLKLDSKNLYKSLLINNEINNSISILDKLNIMKINLYNSNKQILYLTSELNNYKLNNDTKICNKNISTDHIHYFTSNISPPHFISNTINNTSNIVTASYSTSNFINTWGVDLDYKY